MNRESHWQQVKSFYAAAQDLPVEEQEAWLAENCADSDVRREVVELLAADRDATGWLLDHGLSSGQALTRFNGVFPPNSPYRAPITPACRGRGGKPKRSEPPEDRTLAEQRTAMRWAKRPGPA